ncbi:MAG TPA: hypothetical protein DEP45_00395, partial [Armatimonadetes bacterium]|nr:hypothetical protein [Armatimonadota bacterium]
MCIAIRRMAVAHLILLAYCALAAAQPQALRFEAEDIAGPAEAWQVNRDSDSLWNLWSTDQDAERKWSEGTVLRSPDLLVDRERPEDGAPPLHAVVTGIPDGTWEVTVGGVSRPLGVSLDGESWRKLTTRSLGMVTVTNGRFELWVDDRYAADTNQGPAYFDYLEFAPTV